MLFTTPEQFVVLAVLLLGGWLLGYASAPNAKKFKRRVREQSDSFTAYHGDAEDKLRAANQRAADLTGELDAVRADHAEAERTIAALRAAAVVPVAAEVAPPVEAEMTPAVEAEAVPAARETVSPAADAAVVPAPAPRPPLALVEAPLVPATAAPVAQTSARPAWDVPLAEPVVSPEAVAEQPAPAAAAEGVTEQPEPAGAEGAGTPPHEARAAPSGTYLDGKPSDTVAQRAAAPFAMTPTPSAAAPAPIGPAESEMPNKGWFASSARDDLTRVRGIDGVLNTRLFGLGVTRFEDLEKLSAEDEMALEQRLTLPVGSIAREQWRTQAALLRAGKDDEHAAHFGVVEA